MDIDLKGNLHDQILVEREGFAFFVRLEYEKLPPFCSHCQYIGHSIDVCKKQKGNVKGYNSRTLVQKDKSVLELKKSTAVYVPKQKSDAAVIDQVNVDEGTSGKKDAIDMDNIDNPIRNSSVIEIQDILISNKIGEPSRKINPLLGFVNNEMENDDQIDPALLLVTDHDNQLHDAVNRNSDSEPIEYIPDEAVHSSQEHVSDFIPEVVPDSKF